MMVLHWVKINLLFIELFQVAMSPACASICTPNWHKEHIVREIPFCATALKGWMASFVLATLPPGLHQVPVYCWGDRMDKGACTRGASYCQLILYWNYVLSFAGRGSCRHGGRYHALSPWHNQNSPPVISGILQVRWISGNLQRSSFCCCWIIPWRYVFASIVSYFW